MISHFRNRSLMHLTKVRELHATILDVQKLIPQTINAQYVIDYEKCAHIAIMLQLDWAWIIRQIQPSHSPTIQICLQINESESEFHHKFHHLLKTQFANNKLFIRFHKLKKSYSILWFTIDWLFSIQHLETTSLLIIIRKAATNQGNRNRGIARNTWVENKG